MRNLPEFLIDFPRCRVHLDGGDGAWVCWALIEGFGAVLWRMEYPENRAALALRAWELAGLPVRDNGNIPSGKVQIIELRKV